MGEPVPGPWALTRRQLLVGSAAITVTWAAGCSGNDDDGNTQASVGDPTTTRPPPELKGDPFTLGVASGDPLPERVVLWTRLAPEPQASDGLGGMPDQSVDVRWEVAREADFVDIARTGSANADPSHVHAVHVDVDGLEPGSDYHYRFRVGDHVSPVGRTHTLPTGSPERFGLAVVNCQWYETGTYAAFRHLLEEDVDLVVHLGDYIYEYAGGTVGDRTTLPTHDVESLTDYRLRYASYRLDEHLQAVHARFPFVLTWDDHEVADNYTGDVLAADPSPDAAPARTAAAYQAWWEHLPVRVGPPSGPRMAIYQHLDVGDLARLYLLDQRQDSDVPPCRESNTAAGDLGDCTDRVADRTHLGEAQETWFAEATGSSTATWNLIGNPVVLAGIDGGNDVDGPQYYLDTWDGFPTARHRFIDQLATVDNPVVLTGDYHAGMVLDVAKRPFEEGSPLVAPELMAPPISSPLFPADVSGRTPQLRQQINGHGYLSVDVTPDSVTARFRVLDDVADPTSPIATTATWVVDAGSPEPRPLEEP